MSQFPILSLLTFLPLVGAVFILTIRGEEDVIARNARHVALWTSVINFLMSLFVWINFDNTTHCYTIDTNGTVHQYILDGTEQVD